MSICYTYKCRCCKNINDLWSSKFIVLPNKKRYRVCNECYLLMNEDKERLFDEIEKILEKQ